MKIFTNEVEMEAPEGRSLFSIHKQVEGFVKESGVREGLVFVGCETESSVFIDSDEPDEEGLREESFKDHLRNIVPCITGNDDAGFPVYNILIRQLLGQNVIIPITKGELHINGSPGSTICYFDNVLMANNYQAHFQMKIIGE